jgi:hypothetical protein
VTFYGVGDVEGIVSGVRLVINNLLRMIEKTNAEIDVNKFDGVRRCRLQNGTVFTLRWRIH